MRSPAEINALLDAPSLQCKQRRQHCIWWIHIVDYYAAEYDKRLRHLPVCLRKRKIL